MLCTARASEGEDVGLEDRQHSRGGVVGRRVDSLSIGDGGDEEDAQKGSTRGVAGRTEVQLPKSLEELRRK
ncbi:hypothetical protein NL676_025290 [Syzygium grande]|nr:hypothetical protein NL676_025290 [Syzygium grande]